MFAHVQVGCRKSIDQPSPAATKTMRSLGVEADKEACRQVGCPCCVAAHAEQPQDSSARLL